MTIAKQIDSYIALQSEQKCRDMHELHQVIMKINTGGKLWFLDGKDASGKIVSNPNIGYGSYTIRYADGTTKPFYQIGMSANTSGISIYVFGIEDKTYLSNTYGNKIGKASVTGYCIKFKKLSDISIDTLITIIKDGFNKSKDK